MIIKSEKSKFDFTKRIVFYIFSFLLFFFTGFLTQRYGIIGDVIVPFFFKKKIELYNFISSDLEVLSINISFKNYRKLNQKRNDALKTGILINDGEYIPGTIDNSGRLANVKIRLKGDLADHFSDGEKLSYRVIVKGGKTILGMDKFSIHHPRTRDYLEEWLFHKVLRDEDIISLRYDFVKVILNGKDIGIFAIEEHFSDIMLENNHRRPGPILKFSEKYYWDEYKKYGIISSNLSSGYGGFHSSNIDMFNKKDIESDSVLLSQYIYASSLLTDFRKGLKKVDEVFDAERLSSYFAITDVFGAHHGNRWNNVRLFFNPITNIFEPIGFDAQPGMFGATEGLACNPPEDLLTSYKNYFQDYEFYKLYLSKLKKYGKKSFHDSFNRKYKDEIDKLVMILRKEWPDYHFQYHRKYNKIRYIRGVLNPGKFMDAQVSINNGEVSLEIGNL